MKSNSQKQSEQIYNNVLVVDDSRAIVNLLTAHIEEIDNLNVISSTTYAQTKKKLEEHKTTSFLCAVLDLTLPDAENGEVVELVQSYDIPSIVLTASIDKAVEQTMKARLVLDYVIKQDIKEIQYIARQVNYLSLNQYHKILIVEDSSAFSDYLSALVKNLRYQVLNAGNGKQALEILEKHPDISLIITDYNMPEMNGLELIQEVRKRYKREELAIIGLSSETDKELTVKLLKTGASDFMYKAVVHDEFYCRINQNINMVSYVRKVKKSATTDFLTNVYNRMSLFDLGEVLYENAVRNSTILAVAMLDADHFKKINDTYGHDAGDKVLISIAKTLKDSVRKSDVIARFGGEEFVCVATIKHKSDTSILFEKLRSAIEQTQIEIGDQSISVTMSIGVTIDTESSFTTMLNKADEAVYQAKNNGRNQVVIL